MVCNSYSVIFSQFNLKWPLQNSAATRYFFCVFHQLIQITWKCSCSFGKSKYKKKSIFRIGVNSSRCSRTNQIGAKNIATIIAIIRRKRLSVQTSANHKWGLRSCDWFEWKCSQITRVFWHKLCNRNHNNFFGCNNQQLNIRLGHHSFTSISALILLPKLVFCKPDFFSLLLQTKNSNYI